LNELALFAGAGGGILGGHLLGWRTVCAVEYDCYAASVLVQRQNDGILQPFPVWDDVRTFDGKPWRGIVQVVSGGFPCTDISVAGKGAGIDGEHSGLWSEMARIVDEVRPCFVYVENSPALTVRGLGRVLGDLAALGYDAQWGVLGAVHSGAPHKRERIWIVAHAAGLQNNGERGDNQLGRDTVGRDQQTTFGKIGEADNYCARGCCSQVSDSNQQHVYNTGFRAGEVSQQQTPSVPGVLPDTVRTGCEKLDTPAVATRPGQHTGISLENGESTWWATEPDVGRVADGVASRVDRLKAIGNGQVPAVAADAWKVLARFRF
jgi:DNA (cytosine-5)-methyltransferase 1